MIHEDNVTRVADRLYKYHTEMYGNFVAIQFYTKQGEYPRTGDKIMNNKLVKTVA